MERLRPRYLIYTTIITACGLALLSYLECKPGIFGIALGMAGGWFFRSIVDD